jgi:hypothetical protein
VPWSDHLRSLIQQYSTNQDYQAIDLVVELERRELFVVEGRYVTAPFLFQQSIDGYVESFHGRASFARERMTPQQAADFDHAVRTLVTQYRNNTVELHVKGTIVWGRPQAI